MTTDAVWVGLGAEFGNRSMEAILSYGVLRTLNTFWDITYKIKTGGADGSQELSKKDIKGDKERVFTEVLIHLRDPLCLI